VAAVIEEHLRGRMEVSVQEILCDVLRRRVAVSAAEGFNLPYSVVLARAFMERNSIAISRRFATVSAE
jgi:hypothetical protein